jgi:DNA polymerase-3 subunit epsilon
MYLIFDIETTGLIKCEKFNVYPHFADNEKYNPARIVQIAWVVLDQNFDTIDKKTYIVKRDNFNITNPAFHGITNKISNVEGTLFQIVMLDFYEALKRSSMIVAHNILFDYNVLLNHLYRYNMQCIFEEFFLKQKFCTSFESTNLLQLPMSFTTKYYKYPSLQELYSFYFKKKIVNAHEAEADVKACADCFVLLLQDIARLAAL